MKYHVVSIGDLREHQSTETCWCKPKADEEEPNVIVHNALDQRESHEQGTRRVN